MSLPVSDVVEISLAIERPQPLELTAADELLALENIDVLRQNGFEIDTNQDGDVASGQDRRLKLVAQPVSKSTVFDMKGWFLFSFR